MHIRPEVLADYPSIASLHARAFGNRAAEAAVVALRRHSRHYDPELALVAEEQGVVAGHVMLLPCPIRLMGQDVFAANLAPIAVEPEFQGRGIGGALITEAHANARRKGVQVSFLLGDPAYYSRFGYRPSAFGQALAEIAETRQASAGIHRRALQPQDLPALRAIWLQEEAEVDFAIDPGEDLLEWLSPNPAVETWVYTCSGEVVGYSRVRQSERSSPAAFLAKYDRVALSMARVLAQEAPGARLVLPLHPRSRSAAVLGGARCEAWESGMACELASGPFGEYYRQVERGERAPGRPVWQTAFDVY